MSRRRDRGQIRKSVANRAAPFIDNGPRQVAKDVRDLMGATAGALGTRDGGGATLRRGLLGMPMRKAADRQWGSEG